MYMEKVHKRTEADNDRRTVFNLYYQHKMQPVALECP